jgi:L-rhamnose mutarotase
MCKILYESKEEYKKICDDFKNELPRLIKENNIDDWTYSDYSNEENFGLRFSAPLEYVLENALNKLSKNSNKEWVNNMVNILSCAIRGLALSTKYMDKFNKYCECEECGDESIYVNFQYKFKEREICNVMIVNVINGILFDDDEDGSTLSGADDSGQLSKVIQFKCNKCDRFCDMLDVWNNNNNSEMCYDCYENI